MEGPQEVTVRVHIDQTDLAETMQKVELIRNLTKEANSLVDELASKGINLSVKVK